MVHGTTEKSSLLFTFSAVGVLISLQPRAESCNDLNHPLDAAQPRAPGGNTGGERSVWLMAPVRAARVTTNLESRRE